MGRHILKQQWRRGYNNRPNKCIYKYEYIQQYNTKEEDAYDACIMIPNALQDRHSIHTRKIPQYTFTTYFSDRLFFLRHLIFRICKFMW